MMPAVLRNPRATSRGACFVLDAARMLLLPREELAESNIKEIMIFAGVARVTRRFQSGSLMRSDFCLASTSSSTATA
jgi:hypothetical protein